MKIDNIDKFGNCVFCHRSLVKNVVANGKVQGVFDADAETSFFKMTNGSMLVVPICRPCKNSVDLENTETHKKIMESVNMGWELEVHHMKANKENFPEFTDNKEKDLVEYYKTCEIHKHEPHHVMR